jgi:hypothetical protein
MRRASRGDARAGTVAGVMSRPASVPCRDMGGDVRLACRRSASASMSSLLDSEAIDADDELAATGGCGRGGTSDGADAAGNDLGRPGTAELVDARAGLVVGELVDDDDDDNDVVMVMGGDASVPGSHRQASRARCGMQERAAGRRDGRIARATARANGLGVNGSLAVAFSASWSSACARMLKAWQVRE